MTSEKTWILIADGGHARVLETIGIGRALVPIEHMIFEKDLPPSRDLGTDAPPRTHDSMGHARHAIEPRSDPHRELKRAFAEEVASHLDAAVAAKAFGRLVVVAPPTTLGDLRQAWSRAVSPRIVAEVTKDLVKVPNGEIRSHLVGVVAI